MKKTFPITKKEVINGEEYIIFDSDVFYHLFLTITSHKEDVDENLVNNIKKRYEKARKIKRRRIRHKKEKQVLMLMYYELLKLIDKSDINENDRGL